MLKILLPVDFSECTDIAVQYALKLAAQVPDAHLLLLHCFQDYLTDDFPIDTEGSLASTEAITQQVLHRNEIEAQELLEELYNSILRSSESTGQKLEVEQKFAYGLPEAVIPVQAQSYEPTLLIMGITTETNIARSIFGTITTHILEDIKVPLLTLPLTCQHTALNNVLYATDFDKTDKTAIATLEALLQPFKATIHCLHITDGSIPADSEKLAALRKELMASGNSTNIRYKLLEGDDVAEALLDYVAQEHINLIALTTRERNLLDNILHPSLAKQLILEANVPLLIFHSW